MKNKLRFLMRNKQSFIVILLVMVFNACSIPVSPPTGNPGGAENPPPPALSTGNRYHMVPYKGTVAVNTEFPFAFSRDGYDFYYIYLGELKNMPLYYGPTELFTENLVGSTYTYTKTTATEVSYSNVISTSREETWSITKEHTESTTDGTTISLEIGTGEHIPINIQVAVERTVEDYVSDSTANYFGVTTSVANTVEYGKRFIEEAAFTRSWPIPKPGYYRVTAFFDADMYLCIVRDSATHMIVHYCYKDYVKEKERGPDWLLDYSDDGSFGKNDSTVFKVDPSIFKAVEESTAGLLDFKEVKNTADWNKALDAIRNGGNGTAVKPKTYVITVKGDVPVSGGSIGNVSNVTVKLNGNGKLYLATQGTMLTIGRSQTVCIDSKDLTLQGLKKGQNGSSQDNYSGSVVLVNGGTLELNKGTISGNAGVNGVYVYQGIFIMNEGKISGNSGDSGGGVLVGPSSSFTMNGGEISGNKVVDNEYGGGGVLVYTGSFTMNGGTISGNNGVDGCGGGVSVVIDSSFTMKGGYIRGNNISRTSFSSIVIGGGVYVYRSSFTMNGGEISNNSVDGYGGGVAVSNGTFSKSGNSIIYGSEALNSLGNHATSITALYKLWIKPVKFNSCVFC